LRYFKGVRASVLFYIGHFSGISYKMNHLNFSRHDTNVGKGIGILLMFAYHLFCFPDRIGSQHYLTVASVISNHYHNTLEYIIGDFGSTCVFIFLFLSGFGLWKSNFPIRKYEIKGHTLRILRFMAKYWLCFAIVIPIGLIFFRHTPRYEFHPRVFLMNFTGFGYSYSREWWFVNCYLLLLIAVPWIFRLLNKFPLPCVVCSFAIFAAIELSPDNLVPYLGQNLDHFLRWQFAFILGSVFARFGFPPLPNFFFALRPIQAMLLLIFIIGALVILRELTRSAFLDILIVPVFLFSSVTLLKLLKWDRVIAGIGRYSLYMWLTHTFFCYYYWPKLVFFPRFSLLVYGWLVLLSFVASYLLSSLYNLMSRRIPKLSYLG